MRKNKKKLKGMTLIEIIISLAIFAMLGVILVLVSMQVISYTKGTRNLNNKVAEQGPVAEAQASDKLLNETVKITVKPSTGDAGVLTGKLYTTADLGDLVQSTTDSNGDPVYSAVPKSEMNGNLNFKYVSEIEPETTQPTT